MSKPKYYSYNKRLKKYIVRKTINKKSITFGRYSSEEEAKKAVELFEEKGWDKKFDWEIKYIIKNGGME